MAGIKRPRSTPPPAIFPNRRRLDSWKEIASYLNRSEKTVRRWEENEGLPVHRLLHEKRSSVYAYSDELETWWKSRKSQEATDVDSSDEESPGPEGDSVSAGETFPQPSVTSISSGLTGNRDETQVDLAPARVRFNVKTLIASLLLLAAGVLFFLSRGRRPQTQSSQTQAVTTTVKTYPLMTFPGEIEGLALSPDASQIAFTWNGPNLAKWDIYVQQIGGDRPLQITHTQSGMITGVSWSPDGRLLAFGRCGDENRGALYTIPALGGPERELTDVACDWGEAQATWTPDGQSLVFSDSCTAGSSLGIAVFTLTTMQKRCLAAPDSNTVDMEDPAVSPDGTTVAFARASTLRVRDIFTVPFRGGSVRRLTYEGKRFRDLMWTRDGKNIVFTSDRGGVTGNKWWEVSAEGGPVKPTVDSALPASVSLDEFALPTASRDGRRFAYVDYHEIKFALLRAHLSNPGGKVLSQEKILELPQKIDSPQISTDGEHIAFVSALVGAANIWNSDADGHNPLQLTSFGGEAVGSAHWSPDGKWIVFDRRPKDHAQIYMIDSDGRNMRAITEGAYENNVPTWSRDGKSIYFSSNRTGRMELWKQDVGSGVAAQVTQHGGFSAVESYDGKYLYYVKFFSPGIWRMPLSGGAEERITDQPQAWYWAHWDITDSGLYFFDIAASPRPGIKFYDFQTHRITPVLQTDGQERYWTPGVSASRNGRTIYYAVEYSNATIMITEKIQ
jgi:Tol biopolymer transport system component